MTDRSFEANSYNKLKLFSPNSRTEKLPNMVIALSDYGTGCHFKHSVLCETFIFGTQLSDLQSQAFMRGKFPKLVNVKMCSLCGKAFF